MRALAQRTEMANSVEEEGASNNFFGVPCGQREDQCGSPKEHSLTTASALKGCCCQVLVKGGKRVELCVFEYDT